MTSFSITRGYMYAWYHIYVWDNSRCVIISDSFLRIFICYLWSMHKYVHHIIDKFMHYTRIIIIYTCMSSKSNIISSVCPTISHIFSYTYDSTVLPISLNKKHTIYRFSVSQNGINVADSMFCKNTDEIHDLVLCFVDASRPV
jgi:hypothetical protein